MKPFKFFHELIKVGSEYSSRSFSVVASVIIGFIIGIAIAVSLIIDVIYDGKIDSDMDGIAWILAGIGALITGGNIGKIFKSKYEKKGEKDV